jgi:hypothetical protein
MSKSDEGNDVPKVKPERVTIQLVGAPEPEPEKKGRKGGDSDTTNARE